MKIRFLVPVIAVLALGTSGAIAQSAGGVAPHHPSTTQQIDQRFQNMDTTMGQAKKAHGAQRMDLMQQHMQLMQEQMQAMHSMMGSGMMNGQMGGAGMMGGNGMGAIGTKGGAAGNNADMLSRMQTRMDMMQQMMGQMLDQQNMMMQSQGK